MIETFLYRVIPTVVETHLGGRDSHRTLTSDLLGKLNRLLEALITRLRDLRYESLVQGFLRSKETCSVCKLSTPAVTAHNFLEALKGTNIGSETDIHLFDGELCSFGCNPDITGRAQVDTSTNTQTVDRRDNGYSDLLKAAD